MVNKDLGRSNPYLRGIRSTQKLNKKKMKEKNLKVTVREPDNLNLEYDKIANES